LDGSKLARYVAEASKDASYPVTIDLPERRQNGQQPVIRVLIRDDQLEGAEPLAIETPQQVGEFARAILRRHDERELGSSF
jgi:hypothetical protein